MRTSEEIVVEQIAQSAMPLVARIDRLATEWLAKRLAVHGISMSEFRIVGMLLGEGKGLTQTELAKRLRIENSSLSVAITKMEAKGVVVRDPDPVDSRVKRIRCSDISQFDEIFLLLATLDQIAMAGLIQAERETLSSALQKIGRNLSKEIGD
jgi:DNA-binding MarR family transcriptional regulator